MEIGGETARLLPENYPEADHMTQQRSEKPQRVDGCACGVETEHGPHEGAATPRPPGRIQLRRTAGWRKPEGAVVVSRPSIFGNPFRPIKSDCCPNWDVTDDNDVRYLIDHPRAHQYPRVTTRAEAVVESVRLFCDDLTYWFGGRMSHDPELAAAIAGLRGRDLACWCPLDAACHADVLLEIANASQQEQA